MEESTGRAYAPTADSSENGRSTETLTACSTGTREIRRVPQDPRRISLSKEVAKSSIARLITSSEVIRFAALDDFADVIRKLYLPHDVPKWQQLVRAAVLIVGTVEDWVCITPLRPVDALIGHTRWSVLPRHRQQLSARLPEHLN